jgi:hypothetical protein
MTLAAAMLLVSLFCASSALPEMRPQSAQQTAPVTKPETATTQDQGTAPTTQNPTTQNPPATAPPAATTPAKKPSGKTQPTTTKRPVHHNKRVIPVNCNSTPATAGQTASGSNSGSNQAQTDPAATATPAAPGTSSAPTNCPPPKVIVRQGGTSEPSIQLAGGAAGQTSHERDTANQMLGTTEANLKKVAGRQLSPNEQDMVNQARQFMEQSKAAVAAGDLERARTLAWKAQLLSEELIKPEK